MMKKDIALVYMVAGLSSRFGGKIKQFAKVGKNNETLIECSLNQAIPAGFTKIVFIVGDKTEEGFKKLFGNNFQGIPVFYALQKYNSDLRDKPWGTADALCSAKNLLDCMFIVCNGDDIYGKNAFKQLVEHLKNNKEEAAIGYKLIDALPENGGANRGIFQIKNNLVRRIKETFNIVKGDLTATGTKDDDLCSMNIFALHPEVVDMLCSRLESFKLENRGDRKIECYLPTELSDLIEQGKIKMKIYPATEKWIGITNPEDEQTAREMLKSIYR